MRRTDNTWITKRKTRDTSRGRKSVNEDNGGNKVLYGAGGRSI